MEKTRENNFPVKHLFSKVAASTQLNVERSVEVPASIGNFDYFAKSLFLKIRKFISNRKTIMKKTLTALCLTFITAVCAFAQTDGEYNKNEFFVGFSHQQIDRGNYDGFNGAEGSYVRNVNRYLGIKGDVSGAFKNYKFESSFITNTGTQTFRSENKESLYNFLGGVQIKDNASKARLKPFGHALAGVAHLRNKYSNSSNNVNFNGTFTNTGFAAALGGGLDIKINDRFDFRAIQADYNPVRFSGYWSNNFRFGIGLVIK